MTIHSASTARLLEQLHIQSTLMLPVVIRAAQHSDLAKLEWFGTYAHFRDLYRRTWLDHQAGQRLMLVADLRGFPVGQVWLDVTPFEYAYLYALRVFEPLQALGIGTQLIHAAEVLAGQHGYTQLQLAVEKVNRSARRLYEREGFQIFGQRVDVWSYTDQHGQIHWIQEDVYAMRKALG
ncbi:MAG: GNAT family N-acetyltransferase [Herpetosiphonaceae bacterium]|nr:GNAT family N-acetyltransferase [Herpetosiphonaceae bacterium]